VERGRMKSTAGALQPNAALNLSLE